MRYHKHSPLRPATQNDVLARRASVVGEPVLNFSSPVTQLLLDAMRGALAAAYHQGVIEGVEQERQRLQLFLFPQLERPKETFFESRQSAKSDYHRQMEDFDWNIEERR